MIIAVVAVGLHTLPTTAIIVMSIAHRYLQQKKRRQSLLLYYKISVIVHLSVASKTALFITSPISQSLFFP